MTTDHDHDDATEPAPPSPPEDITDPGALAYFRDTVGDLDRLDLLPDPRELALITTVAYQIQHVHEIAEALAEHGMMSVGSMGQPVASPLLAAHAQAVNALNALLFKAKGIVPAEGRP